MIKRLSSLLTLVLLFPLLPVTSAAAQTQGIGISPALQEITLGEGDQSAVFTMSITNTTTDTADLLLSTLDFGALDESGGIAFLGRTGQETTRYGLRQWMVLEKDRLTLEPSQTSEVKIIIENKEGLGPGGHYGAVIVSTAPETGVTRDEVAVLPAASTLVLLKKTGGEKTELKLESSKANSSWLQLPTRTITRFQNGGNVHVVPRGTVELYGPTGSRLSRDVINPDSSYVLPESFRQYTVPLHQTSQPWLPGRYKLVTSWRYDGQEQATQHVQYVWYIGRLLLGLLAILSLVIVLYLYVRYRRRPATRQQ